VQYVPHAFGWKAMNLPLCLWLLFRRREPVWTMFHEVAFPFAVSQPIRHNLLAVVTRLMALTVASATERIFVSIPAWDTLLHGLTSNSKSIYWLPVPSCVHTTADLRRAAEIRRQITPDPAAKLVGSFGAFAGPVRNLLIRILPGILERDRQCVGLLLGENAEEFARKLVASYPMCNQRLYVADKLSSDEAANHLAACDILVQPYPDGVTTRRTSLMAGLALGLPIVTNQGAWTEPVWAESGAVSLVLQPSTDAFIAAAERLLADREERAALSSRAASLYASLFALEHTLRALRS